MPSSSICNWSCRASPIGQSLIQSGAAAPPTSQSFPAGRINSPPCATFLLLWMTDDCSGPFALNKEGAQKRATERGGRVDADVSHVNVSCVEVLKYTTNDSETLPLQNLASLCLHGFSSYILSHFTASFDGFCVVKQYLGAWTTICFPCVCPCEATSLTSLLHKTSQIHRLWLLFSAV